MDDYFSRWFSGTNLQRDQLEKDTLGKTVIWSGKITSIESGDNGGVRVVVHAQTNDVGRAFLDFDASQRARVTAALAALARDAGLGLEGITVNGHVVFGDPGDDPEATL